MGKIRFRLVTPLGELTALPQRPLAGFGGIWVDRKGKGKKKRRKERYKASGYVIVALTEYV